MSKNVLGQKFIDLFEQSDLAIDVHGGNPYSPIWTCGMEFGGGQTHLYKYIKSKYKEYEYDHAGNTQLIDDSPGDYEYAWLITELVGCLTDKYLFNDLKKLYYEYLKINKMLEKNKKEGNGNIEELTNEWNEKHNKYSKIARYSAKELCIKGKYFCANGHGFRMNAFPLSLPNNDEWDRTFVYYSDKRFPISVKDFIQGAKIKNRKEEDVIIEKLEEYKEGISNIFKKWVQKRIEKYRPRLIICTGKKYEKVFKELFLGENAYDEKNIIGSNLGEGRYTFNLYKNNKTESFVLICNFLTDRRPYTIHEIDIIPFVETIKNVKGLEWLDSLKAPEPIKIDKETVEEIDFTFQKIPDKNEFFNSREVIEYLKKSNAESDFYKILEEIEPNWKSRYKDAVPLTNGAKFFALLGRNLDSKETGLRVIKDLYSLICKETNNQNIKLSKQYYKDSINEFKKLVEVGYKNYNNNLLKQD